jgi:hypothetical protein
MWLVIKIPVPRRFRRIEQITQPHACDMGVAIDER